MRLHSLVERRIFEREVQSLEREQGRLRALGVWLARVDCPQIDVMLVPHAPLVLVARVPSSRLIVAANQPYDLRASPLPGLAGRAFGVRLDLSGYDQRPASVQFFDLPRWTPATAASLPAAQIAEDPARPMNVLISGHPVTGRPFLCMRGVREYHEHPQHDGDDWALYRPSLGIVGLLEHVARAMVNTLEPRLQPSVQGGLIKLPIVWALAGQS